MLQGKELAVGALFLAAFPGLLAAQFPDDAAPAELVVGCVSRTIKWLAGKKWCVKRTLRFYDSMASIQVNLAGHARRFMAAIGRPIQLHCVP
jgi:hypothetical protein